MAKTNYQKAATDYAREYLEQLLKMEDVLGKDTVNKKADNKPKHKQANSKD